jgi:uncharacterized membrane protein YdcZ (DUF606 family)
MVGSMSKHFHVPIWGALTSFGVGLACLTVLVVAEMIVVNKKRDTANTNHSNYAESKDEENMPTGEMKQDDVPSPSESKTNEASNESQLRQPKPKPNPQPTLSPSSNKDRNSAASSNKPQEKLIFLRMSKWPRWFHLLAGVIGIVYVTAALVSTQYIGTALFFLPIVVGQIAASTLIDVLGE